MPVFVKNLHVIPFLGLFSLLSLSLPSDAEDVWVGKVIYAPDKLLAVSSDHPGRSLKRGSPFFQGDVLKTTEASRVQLRFRDSAIMVLRPETEFRIDEFSYVEATDRQLQNEAFIFRGTLLKGSLRTIAGDIGKRSQDTYLLNTPFAAIFQTQDANYELVLGNTGLAVAVWEGSLVIENEGGSLVLGRASDFSYALITEDKTPPQGLLNSPDLAALNKTVLNEAELNKTELSKTELNKEERIKEEPGSDQVDVGNNLDIHTDKQEAP